MVTSTAATIGPTARPTLASVLLSVTALRMSPPPTISETNASRAGLSSAVATPNTVAITNTIHRLMAPVTTSNPSASDAPASDDWVTRSVLRLS